ncbi:MAG: response regulator [Roseibium sp.]|nr:response regulator [Roseibium sp.]
MPDVLIIDDDMLFRNMLRDMLEELKYRVVEAEDGRSGVERFREIKVDFVMTDILMPNQEGIETIQKIKHLVPDVAIIAMSGGGSSQNMTFLELAGKLGADRILPKPFGLEDLEQVFLGLRG